MSEYNEYQLDVNLELAEAAIRDWEKRGGQVIYSSPNRLLLDLDTYKQFHQYTVRMGAIGPITGLRVLDSELYASKSGNSHVVLHLDKPLPIFARIALQAILGSDPTREMISIKKVLNGLPEHLCSVLFRPGKD